MISILNTLYSTVVRKGAAFSAVINGLFATLEARSTYFENEKGSKTSVKELEDADILSKASIVLTPTGYSKDAIHNVKPSSAPFGDMTLIQNGTTTRVDENGLVVDNTTDIPRIDYSTGEGAILCELPSTNEIRYSEDFSNALWAKSAVGLSSSTDITPRGTSGTVYVISRAPAAGSGLSAPLASSASGNGVGMSLWVRRSYGSGDTGDIWIGRETGPSGAAYGTGTSYSIGSKWQRIEYKSTGYTGTSRMYINPQYGHGFQIWGAQAEKTGMGAPGRVTSYIPTTSSSVTRVRDNYLNGGDSTLIGPQEGVLYIEAAGLADGNKSIALSASNSAANRVYINYSYTTDVILGRIQASTSSTTMITGTAADYNSFNKVALKYKSGDIALWINGTEVGTSTNVFAFNAPLDELAFDQGNGTMHWDGNVKQLAVFKEALSDTELAALTS